MLNVFQNNNRENDSRSGKYLYKWIPRQSLHRVSYVMMSVTMSGLVMMGITPPALSKRPVSGFISSSGN